MSGVVHVGDEKAGWAMFCGRAERKAGALDMGRLALVALAVIVSAALAAPPASAQAVAARRPGDDHGPVNSHNGNGTGNNNYLAFNSPTNLDGLQQVAVNISTITNTQAAFCKKRTRHCKIVQKIRGNR
jgi:hypothetical protein